MKILRYKKIAICITLLVLLVSYTIFLNNSKYGEYTEAKILINEPISELILMNVGDKIDITEILSRAKNNIDKNIYSQIDVGFVLEYYNSLNEKKISLEGNKITANNMGLTKLVYSLLYVENVMYKVEQSSIVLANIYIYVQDNEEEIPVHNIADLGNEYRRYILKDDIYITNSYENTYVLDRFNGILENPEGFKIVFEDTTNATVLINSNYGLINDVIIDAYLVSIDYDYINPRVINNSQGYINKCTFNINFDTHELFVVITDCYGCTFNYDITMLPADRNRIIINLWKESSRNNIVNITHDNGFEIILPSQEDTGDNIINVSVRSSGEED